VATVNGTAGLHLSLIAAGVGADDLVAVPDWAFVATANAVRHAGATPLLVDVSSQSWTLDPELLAEALDARPVKAVIAVDALGHPADMDALAEVCARHGATLIEDAAGAIGARYRGRPAGGLGEMGVFSFNGNKTVTAGGGGMIVTDNQAWAARARHLSTQARAAAAYRHDAVGFNYRMTNLNAAVGLAQLERLDEMTTAKRRIADIYRQALSGRDDLVFGPHCDWAESNGWLSTARVATSEEAGDLISHLAAAGIEARRFWQSLKAQVPFEDCPARLSGISAALSETVVALPCSSGLDAAALDRVIAALGAWRGRALRDLGR
jgi:dTDP-4-amino-4,6-dideoxygalactose transaminase